VIICLVAAAFSPFLLPSGMLKATYRSKISSSVSLSSSMLIYSTGSISGSYITLAGGAVGVGAIYIIGIGGVADADICIYRMARAHLDKPSTSSTSFRRFLWRSTVLASSWSDGDRSAPFRLSWCLSPNPACSYFATAVSFSSRLLTLSSVDLSTVGWPRIAGCGLGSCCYTLARVFSLCSSTIILSTSSVTKSSRCVI
jgi:hypothetical protein